MVWKKSDKLVAFVFRNIIKFQYRISGRIRRWCDRSRQSDSVASKEVSEKPRFVMQSANPFIECEIGRLGLAASLIPTTIRETYAQCNEDIIVESLLVAKCILNGRSVSSIRYLEIGGNHPVQTSSTYLFYRAWGARGFIVEANHILAKRLRSIRSRDTVIECAVSDKADKTISLYVHELDELSSLSAEKVGIFNEFGLRADLSRVDTVANIHINDLFDKYIDTQLDFMSIDIEGLDLAVLQALDSKHRPAILQVECVDQVLLGKLRETLEPRGYRFFGMTAVNVFFVQQ